jgi:hypothetical protein
VTEPAAIVPLAVQVACVKREVALRERAYPRWVANGKMAQQKADQELAAMRAVSQTIARLQNEERLL